MRYTLSCPEPQTHHLHVSLELDLPGGDVELFLPVWTPGSYLVREFARHLERIEADDGEGGYGEHGGPEAAEVGEVRPLG